MFDASFPKSPKSDDSAGIHRGRKDYPPWNALACPTKKSPSWSRTQRRAALGVQVSSHEPWDRSCAGGGPAAPACTIELHANEPFNPLSVEPFNPNPFSTGRGGAWGVRLLRGCPIISNCGPSRRKIRRQDFQLSCAHRLYHTLRDSACCLCSSSSSRYESWPRADLLQNASFSLKLVRACPGKPVRRVRKRAHCAFEALPGNKWT